MILLVDIGNTTIGLALVENDKITKTFKLNTSLDKSADQYHIEIDSILKNTKPDQIIIASVVPNLTRVLTRISNKYYNIEPLIVQTGVKTGINIKSDNPKEVGADIIAVSAAVSNQTKSSLIIDLGTATKYIYIKKNALVGVIITPGVFISIKSLVGNTALLPQIDIEVPKNVLGKNTIECMQSGVTYGMAAQIDGLIEMIKAEVKENFDIYITGGLSEVIIPLLTHEVIVEKNLIYKGLYEIYKRNIKTQE